MNKQASTSNIQARCRRPALRYHGGKWLLAPWIVSFFPAHRTYVEAYGGGGSVLLRKPRSYGEIYNELNPEIVSFFQVLRDRQSARELERQLRLTPFARQEFAKAYEATDEPIELARRLVVRCFMGFGSAAANRKHHTGFRSTTDRKGTTPAQDWRGYPDCMRALTERLQGVVIESRPALELIQARDQEGYLFYLDPTYLQDLRSRKHNLAYGQFEMTEQDHRDLAGVLNGIRGMAIVSGYDSDLYRELYPGWAHKQKRTHGNGNRGATPRTEVLWLNPSCHAALGDFSSQ